MIAPFSKPTGPLLNSAVAKQATDQMPIVAETPAIRAILVLLTVSIPVALAVCVCTLVLAIAVLSMVFPLICMYELQVICYVCIGLLLVPCQTKKTCNINKQTLYRPIFLPK